MKRMNLTVGCIVLVALFGCAPEADQSAAEPEPPQEVASQAPDASEASASPTVLSMNYIEAATALAADDFERAKASLTALADESTGELQTLARDCAGAADIAAMRESFKSLSTFATGMELPKDYAVAFCPMYQGGAKWVQKRDTLANPYFGKSMLTCGSFVN